MESHITEIVISPSNALELMREAVLLDEDTPDRDGPHIAALQEQMNRQHILKAADRSVERDIK